MEKRLMSKEVKQEAKSRNGSPADSPPAFELPELSDAYPLDKAEREKLEEAISELNEEQEHSSIAI
jgi:hypothetical protein